MNKLNQLLDRCKMWRLKSKKLKYLQEVELMYNVISRNGSLYITCYGNPIMEIEQNRTVGYVIEQLSKAKQSKLSYDEKI